MCLRPLYATIDNNIGFIESFRLAICLRTAVYENINLLTPQYLGLRHILTEIVYGLVEYSVSFSTTRCVYSHDDTFVIQPQRNLISHIQRLRIQPSSIPVKDTFQSGRYITDLTDHTSQRT